MSFASPRRPCRNSPIVSLTHQRAKFDPPMDRIPFSQHLMVSQRNTREFGVNTTIALEKRAVHCMVENSPAYTCVEVQSHAAIAEHVSVILLVCRIVFLYYSKHDSKPFTLARIGLWTSCLQKPSFAVTRRSYSCHSTTSTPRLVRLSGSLPLP